MLKQHNPAAEKIEDHYSRPRECPTKLLFLNEAPEFLEELQRRKRSAKDCRAIRHAKRAAAFAEAQTRAAKHDLHSGDVRRMK